MENTVLPRIGERDVRARLGDKNFERARSYAAFGAVFDARRVGRTLKARCESSGEESYRVRADFDLRGVTFTECSCPIGEDGPCKHVGALLLTWCRRPQEFVESQSVQSALEERSREELVLVLREVLSRRPELEPMLETLIVPANDQSARAEPSVRQRVGAVFRRHSGDDAAAERIAKELDEILSEARALLVAGAVVEAATHTEELSAGTMGRCRKVHDEGHALGAVIDASVDVMVEALVALRGDVYARRSVLRAGLGLFRFDVEQGVALAGHGSVRRAVMRLASRATESERAEMSQCVRDVMERCEAWARRGWASLLMELDSEVLDDAAWMTLWQTTKQTGALVRRHIARGRSVEAAAECARVSDNELAVLADVFETAGFSDVIEELVRARAERSAHPKLVAWLESRAALRQDVMAPLIVAETVFHARPDVDGYAALKRQCEAAGAWAAMAPRVRDFLDGRAPTVLAEVALIEGDLACAVALALSERLRGASANAVRFKVAQAADQTRLPEALRLYRTHCEALIGQRGRPNYREACRVALRVSELMESDREGFAQWLTALRERHETLTALREEMEAVFGKKAA